ncbi:MAG TPA: hypothetical protein VJV05_04080 [Pyrinomonadaceae bacterium]|nr:hypothetical protein [Pyrinomonadaceae bacterium]
MNIAIFTRVAGLAVLSFAILLGLGASNETSAQRSADAHGTYSISTTDTMVGIAPGQGFRLMIYNGAANTVVPQVKIYSGTGTLLLSGSHTPLAPGQFDSFKLNYTDLEQIPGEPGTGRREVRIELFMSYTGLEADAKRIRQTYDLIDTATGQSILIGMLLPAIQKVR